MIFHGMRIGKYYCKNMKYRINIYIYPDTKTDWYNWASEASPTLGCSIKISSDICIYVYMCVCRGPKSVGGITWAKHVNAQSQYWEVKSDQ